MSHDKSTLILGHSAGSQTSQLLNLIGELRPHWKVVAVVNSARQFADELDRYNPDFCVLDLGDGHESSTLVGAHDAWSSGPTLVISRTSSDAVMAFDLGATDFVTSKPLKKERLEAAFERLENIQETRSSLQGHAPASEENPGKWAKFLKVLDGSRLLVVPVEEVRYLQADQKYTRVFLGNRSGIVRHSLGKVYEHLNREQFWQMHRSTVINANYIREVERDDLGRMKVKVADYSHSLQVAKPKERLFRDSIFV